MTPATESALGLFCAAGLPERDAREWSESFPITTGEFKPDAREYGAFWRRSAALLGRLPAKSRRNEAERAAADALLSDAHASRESFLAAHVEPVYDRLTERGSTRRPHIARATRTAPRSTRACSLRMCCRARASANICATPCSCRARRAPRSAPNSPHAARSISALRASPDAARPFISTLSIRVFLMPRTTRPWLRPS